MSDADRALRPAGALLLALVAILAPLAVLAALGASPSAGAAIAATAGPLLTGLAWIGTDMASGMALGRALSARRLRRLRAAPPSAIMDGMGKQGRHVRRT